MLFIEYDWTSTVYRFRIGNTFSDFRGTRSADSLAAWREILKPFGLAIGAKSDSRTWPVVSVDESIRTACERNPTRRA